MKDKEGRKKGKTYVKLRKPRAASPVKTMLLRMTGKGRKQRNTYVKLRKPRAVSLVKTML